MTNPHAILATCAMIAAVVVTATAGDILTASAMRQVGDLDVIRARSGIAGAALAVVSERPLRARGRLPGAEFLLAAVRLQPSRPEPDRAGGDFPHLRDQRAGGEVVPARACGPSAVDGGDLRVHRGRVAGVLRVGDSGGSTPWDVYDSAGGLPPPRPPGIGELVPCICWWSEGSRAASLDLLCGLARPWRFSLIGGSTPWPVLCNQQHPEGSTPMCCRVR